MSGPSSPKMSRSVVDDLGNATVGRSGGGAFGAFAGLLLVATILGMTGALPVYAPLDAITSLGSTLAGAEAATPLAFVGGG